MPSLVYISEDTKRMIFPLGRATLMVGRGDKSQIKLPDESISNNHASIVYEKGQFILQDNGSLNGSYVNGIQVTRHPLKHRDILRFGQYLFMVDLEDCSPPPIRPPPVMHVDTASEQIRIMRNLENKRVNVEFHSKARGVAAVVQKPVSMLQDDLIESPNLELKLTPPVPVNPEDNRYAQLAFYFGLLALISCIPAIFLSVSFVGGNCPALLPILFMTLVPAGFVPAIYFGYRAKKAARNLANMRIIGMTLGGVLAVAWCGMAIYGLGRMPSPSIGTAALQFVQVKVPRVTNAVDLLRGDMMWCPPWPVIQEALASATPGRNDTAEVSFEGGDKKTAIDSTRSTWSNGLIIYEPAILRMEFGTNLRTVRLVLEDCKHNPTFWDFNSTVVPAKKNVLGSLFIVPGLDHWTFFERSNALSVPIEKYNAGNVPWSLAMRGITLSIDEIPVEVQRKPELLKCGMILKPATITHRLVINTREGDALRDWDTTYTYNLFPSEFIGAFLFSPGIPGPIGLQLNPALFQGGSEEASLKWIRDGFTSIVQHRPPTPNHFGEVFKLGARPAPKGPADLKASPAAVTSPPPAKASNPPSK